MQHQFDAHTVSLIAISYNIAAMLGSVCFGALSERIGRKRAIMLASLPVLPLWAFSSGDWSIGVGAFLMQFVVQGAWGVVPTWLTELVPARARAVLPGFVYLLGNLIASVNAMLQSHIAEAHSGNYGRGQYLVKIAQREIAKHLQQVFQPKRADAADRMASPVHHLVHAQHARLGAQRRFQLAVVQPRVAARDGQHDLIFHLQRQGCRFQVRVWQRAAVPTLGSSFSPC
nr:MFS transporter [Candidatus Pantoea persica]